MSQLHEYLPQLVCLAGVFGSAGWLLWSRRPRPEQGGDPVVPEPAAPSGIEPPRIVLPSSQTAPTTPDQKPKPSGDPNACKCCGKLATKARPYSSVPWLDTVEWLNRRAKLNSMPRQWIVKRPHVDSD